MSIFQRVLSCTHSVCSVRQCDVQHVGVHYGLMSRRAFAIQRERQRVSVSDSVESESVT